MSATQTLSVKMRTTTGKGVARKLRAEGRVPAVLYGPGKEPLKLSVDASQLRHALTTEYGNRILLQLAIEGEKKERYAILKDLQRHPLRHDVLHADLLAVEMDRPVVVRVPLRAAPGVPFGVKNQGGVLEWMRRDVTIRVLPDKMPAFLTVDIEPLELGQSLTAKDVVEGQDVELAIDDDTPICHVVATRMSLEVTEAEGEEEGAEGEEAAAEGESGEAAESAEGGEKPQG